MDRREFIKHIGGAAVATSVVLSACKNNDNEAPIIAKNVIDGQGEMTYRTNPNSGDKVSLLGYGMMRLPIENGADMRKDPNARVDQEMVNEEVDYALAHGVNYFDTAPVYTRGYSETSTGIALSRHPRNSYYIATKLSNFSPSTWDTESSKAMFENSLKKLQTDYIDYLLLHSIGGSNKELNSMEMFNARFMDNGILDWLVEQKKAGRIRNLGFSFHGDPKLFDTMMQWHDEGRYHWDFVQIQLNYVDWSFGEIEGEGVNSSYLYEELHRRGIPAVIMEPLLGGGLAKQPDHIVKQMIPFCRHTRRDPHRAEWHDIHGTLGAKHRDLFSLTPHQARRRRVFDAGSRIVHQTEDRALHRLQLLHAMPLRFEHPCRVCLLQREYHPRQDADG